MTVQTKEATLISRENGLVLDELIVPAEATVRDVLNRINENGRGIVFAVDGGGRFVGLVTDGDIRRALLKGARMESPAGEWLNRNSVTAAQGTPLEMILRLLDERVRCIPILDADHRPVDFAALDQNYHLPVAEPSLTGRELEYVTDCIATNWISSRGKYVDRFESEFAALCDARFAISTSNGTTALHLALAALGVGPGDEVIVPDLTFIATANAVTFCGAKAVLVDIDPWTWTMSPAAVEAAVTPRTRGLIPVHLYGHPADMGALGAIAERHGLFLLEDCAEALGARYRGRIVGAIGTAGCFSFYGNKTLTTGEGGMVVTNDAEIAQRARLLRDHGMSPERRYVHPVVGFNYRLTNLQAAVGVAQLERIDEIFARKRRLDATYRRSLSRVPGLALPPRADWAEPVCWLFSLLLEQTFPLSRDTLLAALEQRQIGCRPLFHPLHMQPPYLDHRPFPVAEDVARRGLSLPSAVTLPDRSIEHVCAVIAELAGRGA